MLNEAQTYAELIDPAQLILIRQAARRVKVDEEMECQRVMGCATDSLSKSAADEFLKHLRELQKVA